MSAHTITQRDAQLPILVWGTSSTHRRICLCRERLRVAVWCDDMEFWLGRCDHVNGRYKPCHHWWSVLFNSWWCWYMYSTDQSRILTKAKLILMMSQKLLLMYVLFECFQDQVNSTTLCAEALIIID